MTVFKIALPGSDISTSKVGDETIDSLYPSPKINTLATPPHVGVISLNWASTGIKTPPSTVRVLHSFPHGYNYIPTVIGSYSFDNGSAKGNGAMPFSMGTLAIIVLDADRTNVNLKYVSFDESVGGTAPDPFLLKVRFYVMAERGHE